MSYEYSHQHLEAKEKSCNANDALGWLKKSYPAITNHLMPFVESAEKRYDKGEYWWELRACDYYSEFEKPKIIYAEIAMSGQFAFDCNYSFSDTTTYIIHNDSKYLLGLLNSKLWTFLFSKASSEIRGGFYRWKHQYMSPLPIRTIDFSVPADVAHHDRMVALVEQMLALHKQLPEARTPTKRPPCSARSRPPTERSMPRSCELYGLTEEVDQDRRGASIAEVDLIASSNSKKHGV